MPYSHQHGLAESLGLQLLPTPVQVRGLWSQQQCNACAPWIPPAQSCPFVACFIYVELRWWGWRRGEVAVARLVAEQQLRGMACEEKLPCSWHLGITVQFGLLLLWGLQ